ncbi:unnamed protein product [Brassica rapa subsp. trilocularis]
METKSPGKSQLGKSTVAAYFNDISPGPAESEFRFRVIRFWEARNIAKAGAFIGIDLLLIDEHTVMQGFISSLRAPPYLPHVKAGATYTLQNFYAAKNKEIYCFTDQSLIVSFSNGSVLKPLDDIRLSFAAVRFRFHAYEDIQANCGLRGDLYGNLCYLLNQLHFNLCCWPLEADEWTVLDEAEIINMRHVLLYLWDQASKDFYKKSTSSEDTSTVILVTTVNPKRLGDVQPTIDYNWLSSNPKIVKRINADEVTRAETMTIGQILAYIKQEYAKEGSFDCIATIDDVERDSAWYYIACIGCQSKAIKGPYSLMCAKCGNTNVAGEQGLTSNLTNLCLIFLEFDFLLFYSQVSCKNLSFYDNNDRLRHTW